MKDKWLELTLPQRILLLLQLGMILLFAILYGTLGRQQVIWYEDAPLRYAAVGETITYSGRLYGQQAVFTVSPGPVLEYRLGDTLYGPYSILYDDTAVPSEGDGASCDGLVGIEVRDGQDVLFRGGYLDDFSVLLFDESGELYSPIKVTASTTYGGPIVNADPSVYDILRIVAGPELVARGHFDFFVLGVLCCVVCAVLMLFADPLFRLSLVFRIRNVESVEPTDWELCGRWASWVLMAVLALVCFVVGLSV